MSELLRTISEDPLRTGAKIRCIAYGHEERLGTHTSDDWTRILDEMKEAATRIDQGYRKAIEIYNKYNKIDIT